GLTGIQPTAASPEEQGRVLSGDQLVAGADPVLDGAGGRFTEGDGALLVAFARDGESAAGQIDVADVEGAQLAHADAGRVEDLHHRPVPQGQRPLCGSDVFTGRILAFSPIP